MKVPLKYPGKAAVMFATGPSLTEEVIETVRPYHAEGKLIAFGCNDAYRVIDYLDVHYACDTEWWQMHHKNALETLPKNCHVWTQCGHSAKKYSIGLIPGFHREGFYTQDREFIHFGSNSGFQQLNLAYHYGIRKFLLVGYNMGIVKGVRHFFGEHPGNLSKQSPYDLFVDQYNKIQPEIKSLIINCTPNSRLKCFHNQELQEALDSL